MRAWGGVVRVRRGNCCALFSSVICQYHSIHVHWDRVSTLHERAVVAVRRCARSSRRRVFISLICTAGSLTSLDSKEMLSAVVRQVASRYMTECKAGAHISLRNILKVR